MINETMRSAIHEALSVRDGDELIGSVKSILIQELTALDPTVHIENTGYFNHTFVPDLVMTWGDGSKKQARDLFLRFSLRAAALGRDVQALAQGSPVLLALREEGDAEDISTVQEEIDSAGEVLVTGVPALDAFTWEGGQRRGLRSVSDAGSASESPLLDLVRTSVMRGGRGLLTTEEAKGLRARTRAENRATEVDELREFGQSIHRLFRGETATRLERAAQLMQVGLTGDMGGLEEDLFLGLAEDGIIRGRLSDSELRVMLPYLLRREDITDDPRYWRHLGSMLSLESLERISADLQGLDLTRLVEPNKKDWLGLRAALTYNVESTSAHVDQIDAPRRWEFRARVLNLILGDLRVMVAADRRRIRTREDNPPARWADIAHILRSFHLTGVTLEGLNRSVQVASEQESDIYRDVESITENIRDDFHVPRVEVATSEVEGAPRISADFGTWAATAENGVSLERLTGVVTHVLGYRFNIEGNRYF